VKRGHVNLLDAPDEAAAVELLHELGCTDGLPVIVPTEERVERMLAGSVAIIAMKIPAINPCVRTAIEAVSVVRRIFSPYR